MKKNTVIFILFLCTFIVFPCFSYAADNSSATAETVITGKAIELKAISVTAEKVYDPVSEPAAIPKNLEIFTEKIDRKDIEKSKSQTAAESIKYLGPNVFSSFSNREARRSVTFRGNNVSTALDGFLTQDGNMIQNTNRIDGRLFEFIDSDLIESVELIKNSTAMIYGPAWNGLVLVKTRKPQKAYHSLKLEYGTFNGSNTKLTVSDAINSKSSYFISTNFRSFGGPDGINAEESNKSVYMKYFYDPSTRENLILTYGRSIGMFQMPMGLNDSGQLDSTLLYKYKKNVQSFWVPGAGEPAPTRGFDPWTNIYSDLNFNKIWNDKQSTNIQISRLEVKNDYHSPRGAPHGTPAVIVEHRDGFHSYESDVALALRHTIKADKNTYRLGYVFDHYYNPTGKAPWEYQLNEDKRHSMYIQAERQQTKNLTLDAGVRRNKRYIINDSHFNWGGNQTKTFAGVSNQWEDPCDNYSVGATYKPTKNDTLSLRYGMFDVNPPYRTASFDDSPLKNEKDKVIDLGYERKFQISKRAASFILDLYNNKQDNAILSDSRAKYADAAKTTLVKAYLNRDTVQKGFEAMLRMNIARDLDLSVGAGSISFTPDVITKPRKTYNFAIDYEHREGWSLNAYGRYIGPYEATISNFVIGETAAGKQDITQNIQYKLGKFWDIGAAVSKKLDKNRKDSDKIYLSVRNLLNKKYETVQLAPDYGRIVNIGYEMRF